MLIYLNKDWLFTNNQSENIEIPINITLAEWKVISIIPEFKAWKYNQEADSFDLIDLLDIDTIRARRQKECFQLIDNKSKLWWEALSIDQSNEITNWYKSWLDAPKLKIIPKKPDWLY